jgi:hypothetical protein
MKKRTPAESVAYFREYRSRKKSAAGATATPPPKEGATPLQCNTQSAAPQPDHCANCAPLAAEVSRLTACIASLEAQITNGSRAKPVPTSEEADPLRVRVVAGKINTYDKGHNIGRIPL